MPPLGFGAAGLGNLYTSMSDESASETLESAFSAGLRYVDTAPYYGFGLSETRVGAALGGSHRRQGLVISTKVGRILSPVAGAERTRTADGFVEASPFEVRFDYSYDGVMRSFEASLARLGLDRVDILLAHDLGRVTHGEAHAAQVQEFLQGGYLAMRSLRDQGAVAQIGLGVNEIEVCLEALEAVDLDVILLAGRYTLLEQGALDRLLPECLRRGTSVIVGGPYNSGVLVSDPDGSAPIYYNYAPAPAAILDRVRRIRAVCAAHHTPVGAAALQFPLGHPAVVSVVAGMAGPSQVREAVDFMNHPIPDALWAELKAEGLVHADAPCPAISPATTRPAGTLSVMASA
jgi:D-threo-aldose 1-dehydrogenase